MHRTQSYNRLKDPQEEAEYIQPSTIAEKLNDTLLRHMNSEKVRRHKKPALFRPRAKRAGAQDETATQEV